MYIIVYIVFLCLVQYMYYKQTDRLATRIINLSGRCSGLVVSALDSGSRGPGSSPGRVIVLCSWARHFTLTVSPPRSKWVLANCQGNLTKCRGVGYLRWTSIPSRRGVTKTQTSDPKNSDPLGVSKTQTRKTQTLWVSRKLRPEKLRPSGCLENSDPKNSDPLGVSKTQIRKTQTLWVSRKLRPSGCLEKSDPLCMYPCVLTDTSPFKVVFVGR